MDRNRLLNELILQIKGELGRGITFWPEATWNEAARGLLSGRAPSSGTGAEAVTTAQGAKTAGKAARQKLVKTIGRAASPKPARKTASSTTPGGADSETTPAAKKPKPDFGPPPVAKNRAKDWEAQLSSVAKEIRACKLCELSQTRINPVINSGSGQVPLVFIGEAPGANEDAEGEAFVGRAGKLLTKIIEAIDIPREDVYITNVLKCRPPKNRNPAPDEIKLCSPFLERQLEILKPRAICTLGLFATQLLLESKAPMGALRGRVLLYRNIPVVPTYHPAALFRNPGWKHKVWEDVQLLRKVLDQGPEAYTPKVEKNEPEQKTAPQSGDLF